MQGRVLVIGAGVSGLTTAKCLVEAGFDVTVVAEKRAEFTPSVVAGALWEWPPAVCGHHTDTVSLRRSKEWAAATYRRFARMAAEAVPGVRMTTAVFYFRQPIDERPAERQKMDEAARHVRNFVHSADLIRQQGVNPEFGLRDAYSYSSPLVETDIYVAWLRRELVSAGCQFETRKLKQRLAEVENALCSEFDAEAIVNCAGLGSIELAADRMAPLRGRLFACVTTASRCRGSTRRTALRWIMPSRIRK